ncbi:MAG: RIFT barrel domain-containing protein [Planctomycetota bacterium]
MRPTTWKISGTLLALTAACAAGAAAGTPSVQLTLTERAGIPRRAEPVTTGIPLPKGELTDAANVRLLLRGKEIPLQCRVAGLWLPGRSVKWLLLDFQADLEAGGSADYVLEYGEGVKPGAGPARPIIVRPEKPCIEIDTGATVFRLARYGFGPFERVTLAGGGRPIEAGPAGGRKPGALITGLQPTVTRALPGNENRGRSHLIYVKSLKPGDCERYTLRFATDTGYTVTGEKSGPQGNGEYRKDFTAENGAFSIPRDAWLHYARAAKGDTYTFATVPKGASAPCEVSAPARVVERGPLRTVLEQKGRFAVKGQPVMEFTARYHFYAGSARVRMLFTLENNDHGGRTDSGNARNSEIGGINCVTFDGMGLQLHPALGEAVGVRVFGEPRQAGDRVSAPFRMKGDRAEIYQDSSGGDRWDRYRDGKFHPRPNSYVSFPGWRISSNGRKQLEGRRAIGRLDVTDGKRGLTVTVRDFWQHFPKALSFGPERCLRVGLFPGQYAGNYSFRSGEHKTHEILFSFHDGKPQDSLRAARAFSHPLRLEPSPAWFARTRALGDLHPQDAKAYAAYEVRNLSTVGEFPPGTKKGPSLLSRIEEWDFYGWMDYGDVPMDFETASGQWGMKYDLDYRMAVQYARTLHPAWWRLFSAAARHHRDVDVHHQPHHPGLHFVKGGTWAHSLHDEAGHKNPNRNRNHFTKDLAFGARGAAAYHYMTGDRKARETCLEQAENALARYMSPQTAPDPKKSNRMGWRGDACTLNRLLAGYFMSGEEKYLERARWQIASCAFDGKPPKHKKTSLWSSVFYMMALARYVEAFPDDRAARSYLLAHIETLRKSVQPGSGIYYSITPQPDGDVTGQGTCSHYNIMAADALAVGYRLTGEARYMEAARRCFAYGVKHACWRNGPATYQQIHSANGATHGNVFMVVDSQLRARGK